MTFYKNLLKKEIKDCILNCKSTLRNILIPKQTNCNPNYDKKFKSLMKIVEKLPHNHKNFYTTLISSKSD
jgi:hypothetical protein